MPFQDKFQHVPLPVLLDSYGIRLKHKLGQNFLSDRNLLQKITEAAAVQKGDVVLEVGCGTGSLTTVLAQAGARVEGVEIDEGLRPLLSDRFSFGGAIRITYADALDLDLRKLTTRAADEPLKVVSNVPYYITSELVKHFLLTLGEAECLVLLVQQEAAEHFTATSGKLYGPLTVLTHTYGRSESLFQVPPGAFTPPPAVRSTLLRLTADRAADMIGSSAYPAFYQFLLTCFRQRRKTLANNLKKTPYLAAPGSEKLLTELLESFGLAADCRPEHCSPTFFACLYKSLAESNQS